MLKCSHTFNLLHARGALSPTERQTYIARVRHMAQQIAERYVEIEEKATGNKKRSA
jgi:glycyl-tRNA synthetase alpha chain